MLCSVALVVFDSVTQWTIALQASVSIQILQARILEWVSMPSSRGSSLPRDSTCISYVSGTDGTQLLHHFPAWEDTSEEVKANEPTRVEPWSNRIGVLISRDTRELIFSSGIKGESCNDTGEVTHP